MSFSDEAAPAEEVAPEMGEDTGGNGGEAGPGREPEAETQADPLTELARQRDEFLLALQRTQADFENYRKRITRMQEEQSARAASALVAKLLPVLDTLDLAQAHLGEVGANSEEAKALTAARALLLDVLSKEGLERVDKAGVLFDPSVHDAVARTEAPVGAEAGGGGRDGAEGGGESGGDVIDQVMRSGYRWRGQVLRPAMVSVRG